MVSSLRSILKSPTSRGMKRVQRGSRETSGNFAKIAAAATEDATNAILSKEEILLQIRSICANRNFVNEATSLVRPAWDCRSQRRDRIGPPARADGNERTRL